jgi:hypothetical protein
VAATRVSVTPAETVPGGTMTATWAGVQIPTTDDFLLLFALGSGSENYLAFWPTGGAAAGTMTFTLPAGLASGSYEIRVLSTDPDFYNLPEAVARSRPIHVGAAVPAAADPWWRASRRPRPAGRRQPVAVTVTVANRNRPGAFPGLHIAPRLVQASSAMSGARSLRSLRREISHRHRHHPPGDVQRGAGRPRRQCGIQRSQQRVRPHDDRWGGRSKSWRHVGRKSPASAAFGGVAITNTYESGRDDPPSPPPASIARWAKDAGTRCHRQRTVATLAAGAQSAGTTTATIPLTTPPAPHRCLCRRPQVVVEASELNNCRAAAATIVVGRPDLVETVVSNPPAVARPGTSFAVTDTVRNQGTVPASASTSHYYFSADTQKSADDRLLTGTRSVPTLAAGAASTLTVTVTIPSATPPGTYFLLACADDTKLVAESDEGNNCLASAGAITVALPDLVQQSVSSSGGPFRRGTAFTLSDTVLNDSRVGTPRSTTTRYYLSADTLRSTGDILLTGARTVPILGPSASSSASAAVTIPSTTLPGTYFLLACADDTKLVAESNEANNCRASGTALVVNP